MVDSTAGMPDPGRVGTAVAVIDTRGTVTGWTKAAEELLGRSSAEVVGRSAALLLMPRRAARDLSEWAGRARLREPWSGTTELRGKDGKSVRASVEALPLSGGARTDWFVMATAVPGASPRMPPRIPLAASLLARSPICVSIRDGDGRYIWANEEARRWDRLIRERWPGRGTPELSPGHEGRAVKALIRQVFETGIPVIEREQRWTVRVEDGENGEDREDDELVLSSTYFRLDGPDGRPLGVCSLATDISKSDGRKHLLVLSEASKSIGTALDVMKTAQELADFAVPRLADYITVDLAESVPIGGEPLQRLTSPDQRVPVFRRAGAASIHPGMPESLWDIGDVVFVPPSSPFTRALCSRQSHYEPVIDLSPGTWVDQDPDRLRTIRATGMHSLVIVPLQARGTLLGEAVFVRNDNRMAFSRDDLLLFEELAGRAALSLDNARRFTRERAASLALQRNLLPRRLAGGERMEVASRYLPADSHEGVGGDWFDALHLPGGRVGLVVGDVVGHGINAAARMGQFRTVVRTLAELDLPPHELLARLDRLVVRLTEQDSGEDGGAGGGLWSQTMGGTCVYAVYDPATRICTMARAGHPPPAVVHPDGGVTFPDLPAGTPIGMGLTSYRPFSMELPEGSIIALYTDGLIESRDADLDEGLSRLGAALARPGLPLEELCSEVIAAMTRNPRRASGAALPDAVMPQPSPDDIALLLARTHGLESGSPPRAAHRV
ncbi:SpoIIE family protein phosphatase [Streptomyces lushanensis]|uniref:SpoIIE family protein phosphatase n=1 Tax=Streptomyces lushanensis TaxID=1434255 RepID=UPI000834D59C|nr:SpoIIE family protein phosphatase [Streptomyces lushanensis]